MDNAIGADAAKLAGLLVDTLQKVRNNQLTLEQWKRFVNLSSADREERFGDRKKLEPTATAERTGMFALLKDLGTITVPDDYVHEKALATFFKKFRPLGDWNGDMSDLHFRNPSTVLKPGDKFRVRAFVGNGETTVDQRMAFLKGQNAVHLGAQGATLVWEQMRDELKDRQFYSYDEQLSLWRDGHHGRKVPFLVLSEAMKGWVFGLDSYDQAWYTGGRNAFLCFNFEASALKDRDGPSASSPPTLSGTAAAAIPAFAET